eukprot:scaffold11755_cov191-Skeletonema_menzelii.AAC.1
MEKRATHTKKPEDGGGGEMQVMYRPLWNSGAARWAWNEEQAVIQSFQRWVKNGHRVGRWALPASAALIELHVVVK